MCGRAGSANDRRSGTGLEDTRTHAKKLLYAASSPVSACFDGASRRSSSNLIFRIACWRTRLTSRMLGPPLQLRCRSCKQKQISVVGFIHAPRGALACSCSQAFLQVCEQLFNLPDSTAARQRRWRIPVPLLTVQLRVSPIRPFFTWAVRRNAPLLLVDYIHKQTWQEDVCLICMLQAWTRHVGHTSFPSRNKVRHDPSWNMLTAKFATAQPSQPAQTPTTQAL